MTAVVKDVMTTEVIWVERDTPFAVVAAALRQYRVSAFPVLDPAGQVIGVVSESDLLNKLALGGGEDGMPGMITGILRHKQLEKARGVTAGDLMTAPPVTIAPGDTVEQAARLMYLRQVKRLPVVDADGRLAGIVSRADVLSVYDRSDAEIAEDVRTGVLPAEDAAEPVWFSVTVADGVVTLAGRPASREQGHDIVGRTAHVQGVVAVRDRFDYPPPGPPAFDVLAAFPMD
jgi:CBS domain-containing protein